MEMENTNNNLRENLVTTAEIKTWLVSYLAELLEIEPSQVDTTVSFDRYGLDSSATMSVTADLAEWLGWELEPALLYDYQTIEQLSEHLAQESALKSIIQSDPLSGDLGDDMEELTL